MTPIPDKLDPSHCCQESRAGTRGRHTSRWDHEDGAAHTRLGGQPPEGRVPAVMYIPQLCIRLSTSLTSEESSTLVSGCGTDPAISQCGSHHRQGICVYLHCKTEDKVECLVEVSSFGGDSLFLLHEVAHREVSVGRCPLFENRIVEPEKTRNLHSF